MQQRTSNIDVFVCLFLLQDTVGYASPNKIFLIGHSNDTFSKNNVSIGTQIPLQFTVGYEYNFSN